MRVSRSFSLLLLVMLGAAAAGRVAGGAAQGRAGAGLPGSAETFEFGGLERSYVLYAPARLDRTRPAPLVLVLHGGGSNAAQAIRFTRMNDLADAHGFIAVYPEGVNRRWNDGRQSGLADRRAIDDVGFIAAVLDRVSKGYRVDPGRIFSTGISNGGFMSVRLACDLSETISAIGVVAATMGADLATRCAPTRPVSVIQMNGTQDSLVPYGGGRVAVPGGGRILSAEAAVERWLELNSCGRRAAIALLPDSASDDGARTRRSVYSGCRGGAEVVFYRIEGGGHTWPGSRMPVRVLGRTTRDFDASQVIWEFFSNHARSASSGQ
jgi:polyhydroxybutyrate depolymerase